MSSKQQLDNGHGHHNDDGSFSNTSQDKEETKSFEQLMMSPLSYLPSFIQPEHHIGDNNNGGIGGMGGLGMGPDHNSLLRPILSSQNDAYFMRNRQESRSYPKEAIRDDDGNGGNSEKTLPILNLNLFQAAFGNLNITPSLSKPSVITAADGKTYFVCGTEEQDQYKMNDNKLIFGQLTQNCTKIKIDFTHDISDPVRDLQWVDGYHVVFAIGSKLGIVRLDQDHTQAEMILFPAFHTDVIREIAISSPQSNLVLSGGFDGKVFVTDISKLYSDIKDQKPKSENSLYPCTQVVGSVRWHPDDGYLASCTTDMGILHIFDVRTDRKRAATVHDTGKKELFTHDYRDQNNIFLGYGDGEIQVFDSRTVKSYSLFRDPFVATVGEIRFHRNSQQFSVFGAPEFALWKYSENQITLLHHQHLTPRQPDGFYKTTGDFFSVPNGLSMAVTDSYGNFSVFGVI